MLEKPELPDTGSLHLLFAQGKMMLLGSAKLTSLPPTGFFFFPNMTFQCSSVDTLFKSQIP